MTRRWYLEVNHRIVASGSREQMFRLRNYYTDYKTMPADFYVADIYQA